ncbi:hypothetical protein HW561_20955 [Rhodobacteraceae bacterium B1Z28]|uniref:Phage baseplate assembly protein n=1 Tax=Ruegeria haliotis TaxID=2747601 RepID=A0ABX2PWU5_9RHOB|nr:hypothetical protein [Ruegeria haliotis]NVO58259.1 hypothetical protein [Ruegeria haliotis]
MSEQPIRVGHSDHHDTSTCGCCSGTEFSTISETTNRPNLTAIAFRAGDHGAFKASMLTGLSSADLPALARLGTRDDTDFSIALIDAWASACDVLTFYQERLANEAYIQTATERLSIGELARLIGYRLHPGAAAETDLVILMDDPPGAAPDVADLDIPLGTRVQSQPGPDEEAQVFETIDPLSARVQWNVLRPRLNRRIVPVFGDFGTWLEGTPALAVGDAILIVGKQRGDKDASDFDVESERWDFRRITSVTQNADLNRTFVTWDIPLGSVNPPGLPAQSGHRFYHLRDRASLFGYNAPHPAVLSLEQRSKFGFKLDPFVLILPGEDPPAVNTPSRIEGDETSPGDWCFHSIAGGVLSLDAVYKSFVKNSWVALTLPNDLVELYRITDAKDDAQAAYAISGKSTRLVLDTTEGLASFNADYRKVSVYGGSEEIAFADTPETNWVAGSQVELETKVELPEGRKLIFRGRRARLRVDAQILSIEAADVAPWGVIKGSIVTLMSEPSPVPGDPSLLSWQVRDADGFTGIAEATLDDLTSVAADESVEEIVEVAHLDHVLAAGAENSALVLQQTLEAAFDRTSLKIYGNVARAAHGEGTTEILGAGDPSRPFQKFLLKQAPVTHRLAASETGVASTLSVRVDGVEWDEMPDLYDRGGAARVYKTSLTDDGETVVEFGDGLSGARPSPGRDNIVADYSRGIGLAGNLRKGQLTLAIDKPLGLRETFNPVPATGGDDPELAKDARRNAPIYTLTLGRVVSITDYRDFALGFPGIAKAEARWVWQGQARHIVVTVAGPDGIGVPPGSTTHDTLLEAFRALGDPLVSVDLLSYVPAYFRLGLRVAVDPAYETEVVLAETEAALRDAFAFEARDFAQLVARSEIAKAAHQVPGVVAIDTDRLYRVESPQDNPIAHPRLISQPGRLGSGDTLLPAEILTLSPDPLDKLELFQ